MNALGEHRLKKMNEHVFFSCHKQTGEIQNHQLCSLWKRYIELRKYVGVCKAVLVYLFMYLILFAFTKTLLQVTLHPKFVF